MDNRTAEHQVADDVMEFFWQISMTGINDLDGTLKHLIGKAKRLRVELKEDGLDDE
jgi:hypothetical protein